MATFTFGINNVDDPKIINLNSDNESVENTIETIENKTNNAWGGGYEATNRYIKVGRVEANKITKNCSYVPDMEKLKEMELPQHFMVLVKNIPHHVEEDELYKVFQKYLYSAINGISMYKGFSFWGVKPKITDAIMYIQDQQSLNDIMKLNGHISIDDNVLEIQLFGKSFVTKDPEDYVPYFILGPDAVKRAIGSTLELFSQNK